MSVSYIHQDTLRDIQQSIIDALDYEWETNWPKVWKRRKVIKRTEKLLQIYFDIEIMND